MSLTKIIICVMAVVVVTNVNAEEEVNIYSYRQQNLVQPLLDEFTKQTGIKTNVLFASKGLAQRIKAEGKNSPVDVMLTTDVGRLEAAKNLGITQEVSNEAIIQNIPSKYRDPEGHWFGLTTRARIIYASKDRVKQDNITYEELAEDKWRGKICTRSGQHVYSIGLIAAVIAQKGKQNAVKWLSRVKNNLARKPSGNDRAQVKAIYAGECDISIGNTYYMGKMSNNDKEPEQKKWAEAVKIIFPNANNTGTHVNISGMVMAKYAPNPKNAARLMEFLVSNKAQKLYAEANFEYPVKNGIMPDETTASWGKLIPEKIPLSEIAKHRKTASQIVDEVRFDEGPDS